MVLEQPTIRECTLAGRPLDQAGIQVIDNHCHLGPWPGFYQHNSDAAGMVRTMDRAGVAQACVFPSQAIYSDMTAGNRMALDAGQAFPGRLLPYMSVDPHRPRAEVKADIARCLDAGGRGIKLHTSLAGYPFDGPGYVVAFEFAHEHRLPLISHGVGTPQTLRTVARTYPNAHFIVAHAGAIGPLLGAPGGFHQVAAEEPNVYLDLTSSTAPWGGFIASVRVAGAGKLLYGSDCPWMCFTHQLGRVLLAPIAEEDKRRILGGTMAALLATRQ